ncbi:MAG: DUF3014 domain-containing protein [Halieaceae bacterium]|nr:DUF3014 domain-containing protein [Halieaceae bacterium]
MKNGKPQGSAQPRLSRAQSGAFTALQLALIISLILMVAGAAYFLGFRPAQDAEEMAEPATTTNTPAPLLEPAIAAEPQAPAEETLLESPEPLPSEPMSPALPTLDESDNVVRDALAAIPLGTPGQQYLLSSNIVERTSSALYLMAQGDVPYKMIPIARPTTPFPISDNGLWVSADPLGFARYDSLSNWLRQIDVTAIFEALEWLIPLFREAWSFYGETPDAFDGAIINTLDSIIATPEVDLTEARLIRKEAVWIYEDPAIEALSPLQKQILRMGPDNALVVKAIAGQTRSIWLGAAN